jgi:uncharacterized protein YukE
MSGLAPPSGDPSVLEQLASRLEAAATGSADLGTSMRQVTTSVRFEAEWSGDAADAYTSFTGDLSQGIGAAQAPLSRIALAVRDYAGYLRAAQQQVAAYASAARVAQFSGGDAGYLSAAQMAGQQAESAIAAWQAAGEHAAAEVSAASGELAAVFGSHGPVPGWLARQPMPGDTLAGMPRLGDPTGPEILKTPGWALGPEILTTPGAERGPEILITPPGELGPEILGTPGGLLPPEILGTPGAPQWPLIEYSEKGGAGTADPNPELPPGYTSSPGLLGDPYNPAAVAQRSRLWQQWATDTNAQTAKRLIYNRQGPREIGRIDRPEPDVPGSQWHAQERGEGSPGINIDGTPHDGDPNWPERVLAWLRQYGWNV